MRRLLGPTRTPVARVEANLGRLFLPDHERNENPVVKVIHKLYVNCLHTAENILSARR
jgi:hypothetical protein